MSNIPSVDTTQTQHSAAADILSFLPLILAALRAALAINSEVGHVPLVNIINDSIQAGSAIGLQIPEHHVQTVAAVAGAIGPQVVDLFNTSSATRPVTAKSETTPIVDAKVQPIIPEAPAAVADKVRAGNEMI